MLDQLFKTPKTEWKKIIAVSRREPVLDHQDERLVFLSVDLLRPVDELVKALRGAGAEETTDVFFYAYIEKADPKELLDINCKLFDTVSWLGSIGGITLTDVVRLSRE